jgi:hypothetical protein
MLDQAYGTGNLTQRSQRNTKVKSERISRAAVSVAAPDPAHNSISWIPGFQIHPQENPLCTFVTFV